jgi:uncharacterized protein YqgC (DUF456 family)
VSEGAAYGDGQVRTGCNGFLAGTIGGRGPGLRVVAPRGQHGRMDGNIAVDVIAGLVIALGIVGVAIPVVPGLLLSWLGVLLWALLSGAGHLRWVVLAIATVVALGGAAIKWLLPGRRLKSVGVPNSALFAGGVLGLIGFFVIPVVGVVIGFVLGVYLVERVRLGPGRAWPSTREAITAAGLAMLIEITASVAVAVVWVFGLLAA